ncbi:cytochrome P450 [Tritonibacter mobilis]|uniref:cytochrome P450 n=1 Tax=Tritonibacter mobilis TaxID=379347 RepID=UPI00103950AC|nr:cytochrome P450 [Tritonibacter mobilis]
MDGFLLVLSNKFNPLDPMFPNNARELFRHMRDCQPVFKEERQGKRIIHMFRYADCAQALQDYGQWSSNISLFEQLLLGDAAIMIQDDPPVHTAYRRAITPWFNHRTASVSKIVKRGFGFLDIELNKTYFDGVALAERISTEVIVLIFGFRPVELEFLKSWYARFGAGVGIEFLEFEGERVDAQEKFVREMHLELDVFLDRVISDPPKQIEEMIASVEKVLEDRRSSRALLKSLIFASGHTLSGQIVNSLEVLASQSIKRQKILQTDLGTWSRQISEECIRIRPVFRGSHRVASRDCEIGGIQVEKGSYLIIWNASANLDDRVYENPESIQFQVRGCRHLSFGRGVHRCIGSVLASQVITATVSQVLGTKRLLTLRSSTPAKDPWIDSFESLELNVQ